MNLSFDDITNEAKLAIKESKEWFWETDIIKNNPEITKYILKKVTPVILEQEYASKIVKFANERMVKYHLERLKVFIEHYNMQKVKEKSKGA